MDPKTDIPLPHDLRRLGGLVRQLLVSVGRGPQMTGGGARHELGDRAAQPKCTSKGCGWVGKLPGLAADPGGAVWPLALPPAHTWGVQVVC